MLFHIGDKIIFIMGLERLKLRSILTAFDLLESQLTTNSVKISSLIISTFIIQSSLDGNLTYRILVRLC